METTVIAFATRVQGRNLFGLKLHQDDVTTAFLIGNLEEEVYMTQPKGFVTEGEVYLVCKLKNMASSITQMLLISSRILTC